MSGLLEQVFRGYLADHPGGNCTLTRDGESSISEDTATNHFKGTLDGSEWSDVRGFHVLRYSFASNVAAEGVDQRMIDEWMGH